LVGLIAAKQLNSTARLNIAWLLGDSNLADIASWADDYVAANTQTGAWHYVNIPADASSYDRDRDCPRQPGVLAGTRNDRWRDCAVDRILYHQARVAAPSLDRADRATALKFLVHFIGDLHQPFHALDVARGGNDIPVVAFGSATCTRSEGRLPHAISTASGIRRSSLVGTSAMNSISTRCPSTLRAPAAAR
jgi:hypothetical protein